MSDEKNFIWRQLNEAALLNTVILVLSGGEHISLSCSLPRTQSESFKRIHGSFNAIKIKFAHSLNSHLCEHYPFLMPLSLLCSFALVSAAECAMNFVRTCTGDSLKDHKWRRECSVQ